MAQIFTAINAAYALGDMAKVRLGRLCLALWASCRQNHLRWPYTRRGASGRARPDGVCFDEPSRPRMETRNPRDSAEHYPRVDADDAAALPPSGEAGRLVALTAGRRHRSSATPWPRLPGADAGGAPGLGRRTRLWATGALPSLRRMPAASVPPSRVLRQGCRSADESSARCAQGGSGSRCLDVAGVG